MPRHRPDQVSTAASTPPHQCGTGVALQMRCWAPPRAQERDRCRVTAAQQAAPQIWRSTRPPGGSRAKPPWEVVGADGRPEQGRRRECDAHKGRKGQEGTFSVGAQVGGLRTTLQTSAAILGWRKAAGTAAAACGCTRPGCLGCRAHLRAAAARGCRKWDLLSHSSLRNSLTE